MFRDLRYDPNNIRSEFDYPSEYVSMVLDFSMQSFDLSLVSGVEQVTRVGTSRTTTSALPLFSSVGDQVLSVRLDVVAVTLSQKSMSQKISFSMRTMNIYDPMCHPKRMDYRILQQRNKMNGNSGGEEFQDSNGVSASHHNSKEDDEIKSINSGGGRNFLIAQHILQPPKWRRHLFVVKFQKRRNVFKRMVLI